MGTRALLHVLSHPTWTPALALLIALASEGCGTTGSRSPRLPLSATYQGVASVQAELLKPADPVEEAAYAGMTRVTLRVESLTRLVYVRSGQVGIDLPDGRQFHPMPPATARERVSRQREQWWRTQPAGYGDQAFQDTAPGSPAAPAPTAKPERTEPLVSRRVVDSLCSSMKFARTFSPAALVVMVPCGVVAALHFATLPEGTSAQQDSDDRQRSLRRAWLGKDLAALKDVELGSDDAVIGTLVFPVASEEIRATPGAVMTIPILEWRSGTEIMARIPLTPSEPPAMGPMVESSPGAHPEDAARSPAGEPSGRIEPSLAAVD